MAALDFSTQSLRFPRNELGTDKVPNFVRFQPVKLEYGNLKGNELDEFGSSFGYKQKSDVTNSIVGLPDVSGNPLTQVKSGIGGIIDNIANGAKSILNSLSNGAFRLSGAVDLFGGNITARLSIGDLGINTAGLQEDTKATRLPGINLYMPPGLKSSLSANIAQQEMGQTMQAILSGGDDFIKAVETGNFKSPDVNNAATAIVKGLGIDVARKMGGAAAAYQRGSGRVANSFSMAMFNGMQHRTFSYEFKLIARNAEDTQVIKDICDSFMAYMLPTRAAGGSDLHFYDIPYMWDISYCRFADINEMLDQPNRCFLQNVDIAYSGEGMGMTYNNGAPIDVTLSLQFMEVEPMFWDGKTNDGNAIREVVKYNNQVTGSGSPTPMNRQGGRK